MKYTINIEDNFEDLLKKAMRGLDLDREEVGDRAGLALADLDKLLAGKYREPDACRVANVLSLDATSLHQLAMGVTPPKVELPEGIRLYNSPFPIPGYLEMTVNSYSVMPDSRIAAGFLIDAGSCFESLLGDQFSKSCRASYDWSLFLTHTHPDHVIHVSRLSSVVSSIYVSHLEPYEDALQIKENETFQFGCWRLKCIETTGHSPGGISYLLEGADVPVVFVGDAIFCCSIGKVGEGYEKALAQIRKNILTLPGNTIICPGHGPLTTVEFERLNNPFFA